MKYHSYSIENEHCKGKQRSFITYNSKKLVIIGMIGISLLVGWRYWSNHHNDVMIVASAVWEHVNSVLTDDADQQQLDLAQHFSDSNDNNYGVLASLGLTHNYINKGDFATAEKQLQKTLNKTHEKNLQTLINLRLAQLQLQQKNVDGALKTLNVIKQKKWMALVESIRGDAQVFKDDHQAARAAYEKALKANPPQALQELVHIKLNNLSS
ncbi:MAG: ancillary SecYEG translocon subunit [Sodalis sp. Ffu]|nr:MAG: ancillary SecYEG translocon subunit [Sodalis sp. Ffu]